MSNLVDSALLLIKEIDRLDSEVRDMQEERNEAMRSFDKKIQEENKLVDRYVENVVMIFKKLKKEELVFLPKQIIEVKTNRWAVRTKDEKKLVSTLIELGKSYFIRRKIERDLRKNRIIRSILNETGKLAGLEDLGIEKATQVIFTLPRTGRKIYQTIAKEQKSP